MKREENKLEIRSDEDSRSPDNIRRLSDTLKGIKCRQKAGTLQQQSRIVGAKSACTDDCEEIVSLMDGKHMCEVIYLTMSHLLIESKAHTINSSASIALGKALGQFERAAGERKNSTQLTIH